MSPGHCHEDPNKWLHWPVIMDTTVYIMTVLYTEVHNTAGNRLQNGDLVFSPSLMGRTYDAQSRTYGTQSRTYDTQT